jgi:hypothetical protein
MAESLFVVLAFSLFLQQPAANPKPKPAQSPGSPANSTRGWPERNGQQDASMPDEMRTRLAIERAEIEHRKIMTSAEQVGALATEIKEAYEKAGKLSSAEIKKLGTIEKLAKRILSHSGGERFGEKTDSTGELTLESAIDRLCDAGTDIKKKVTEKTRFVVSMEIISGSNDIIHLVQFIRRNHK